MKFVRKIATVAGAATLAVGLIGMPAAYAASSQGGDYPNYAHEGTYRTSCGGTYNVVRSASTTYKGATVTLHLYYNGSCGAYGELSGSTVGTGGDYCKVYTFRGSNSPNYVAETVDAGDHFAYTKLVNDLNGRTAYSRASCGVAPGQPNDGHGFVLVTTAY